MLDDQIDAALVGPLEHFIDEIDLIVVDDLIGPQLLRAVELPVRARRREDVGAASLQIWIAAMLTPELAEFTSTVSPALRLPRPISMCHAVPNALGKAAACSKLTVSGNGMR